MAVAHEPQISIFAGPTGLEGYSAIRPALQSPYGWRCLIELSQGQPAALCPRRGWGCASAEGWGERGCEGECAEPLCCESDVRGGGWVRVGEGGARPSPGAHVHAYSLRTPCGRRHMLSHAAHHKADRWVVWQVKCGLVLRAPATAEPSSTSSGSSMTVMQAVHDAAACGVTSAAQLKRAVEQTLGRQLDVQEKKEVRAWFKQNSNADGGHVATQ